MFIKVNKPEEPGVRSMGDYLSRGERPLEDELRAELERRRRVAYQRVALGLVLMFGGFLIGVGASRLWTGSEAVWALGWLGVMFFGVIAAVTGGHYHRSAVVNLRHGVIERFEPSEEALRKFEAAMAIGAQPRTAELARRVDVYPRLLEMARVGEEVVRTPRRVPIRPREPRRG